MTLAHLVACPGCTRHVRVSESACPFCGEALDAALRASPPPRVVDLRRGRAALYAIGAGTMTLAAACSSPPAAVAFYGVPPDAAFGENPFDAGPDAQGHLVGMDASNLAPMYGLAPQLDAGHDAPALIDAAQDAAKDAAAAISDAPAADAPLDGSTDH